MIQCRVQTGEKCAPVGERVVGIRRAEARRVACSGEPDIAGEGGRVLLSKLGWAAALGC